MRVVSDLHRGFFWTGARIAILCTFIALLFLPISALAGGPKYVAGASDFNADVLGQPVHWSNGQVNYFVDPGPLNSSINHQQATAMVDAAAAIWSAVPTAGVALIDQGTLHEDVSGANIAATNGVITQPSDVTPSATRYPVGVIFDEDGSVIDAIYGTGASEPTSCQNNGVLFWLDNFNPDATIAHGIILLNGLCATNDLLVDMMNYELVRAFGRILNLDYAQVNPGAFESGEDNPSMPNGVQGWPIMQPLSGFCGTSGGVCLPNPNVLRYDDIAALDRIYPITEANQASFPSKQITAAHTVSIQGTITFRNGVGMQGVNVEARPLDANGNPLYEYTTSFVSGSYFNGNHGNPVTGFDDADGNPLTRWGSKDAAMQGYFDLSGIPLPPNVTSARYQLSFEAVNPLYILEDAVGPYLDGQPTPSGTLAPMTVAALSAGDAKTLTVKINDSAAGDYEDAIGTEIAPRQMPTSGMWAGRLSQVGQSDWFTFPVRGGRSFSIVTQALDERGAPTETKAMPALGVWDAYDPVGAPAVGAGPGMNGDATGESWLSVTAQADDLVRIGISDQRGDGRPDYAYNGWVLYADTISPLRLPAAGGPIVIEGMGFRMEDTVLIGGQTATITSLTPNEITAIAPAAASGVTGSVNVEVDDLPRFNAAAVIADGISYDSGTGDALTLVTAPANTVPIGVPTPFTVTALGANLVPAGGVTVIYTVTSGTATLACGQSSCSVTTTGDGHATMNVTAVDTSWSIVTARLINNSSLQAQFQGGTPPQLAALTPQLSLAAGATVTWPIQAIVLSNGQPLSGQAISWQSGSGITSLARSAVMTGSNGTATILVTVGPLTEGQTASITACLNGTRQCVTFTAFGARPEYAVIESVSGTEQTLAMNDTPSQITLRLLDMDGNPMAGGTATLDEAIYAWAPPCPAHGLCLPSELLSTATATATSALDGSVVFTPATIADTPTMLLGLAVTGNTSSVRITIEQHP